MRANGVRGLADGRERVDEFGARAFAVGHESRDVAAVDAAAGDEQVVPAAPGDAAQLHLAPRGARFRVRRGAGRGEPRVTLDALARRVELVALRLFGERARVGEQVFDDAQRDHGRALHLLHAPPAGRMTPGGVRAVRP